MVTDLLTSGVCHVPTCTCVSSVLSHSIDTERGSAISRFVPPGRLAGVPGFDVLFGGALYILQAPNKMTLILDFQSLKLRTAARRPSAQGYFDSPSARTSNPIRNVIPSDRSAEIVTGRRSPARAIAASRAAQGR